MVGLLVSSSLLTTKIPIVGDIPGNPVKTLPSTVGYADLIPGQGIKIPHNSQPKKKKKKTLLKHKTETIFQNIK